VRRNSDGTIDDSSTGLTWTEAFIGPGSATVGEGLTMNMQLCSTWNLAGGGWRVPTPAELEPILSWPHPSCCQASTVYSYCDTGATDIEIRCVR
jgi:hypothetical protein